MKRDEVIRRLEDQGVKPSPQRVVVGEYVLSTDDHPSADDVWARVKRVMPELSRATVYNTLNLFVEKGLVQQLVLAPGKVVFDPIVAAHHHFIDEATGRIHDIAWDALEVKHVQALKGFDVRDYAVVLRGRKGPVGRGA